MGPGGFFPTNPDLVEILGKLILIFWIPNSKISRSPEIWRGPGLDWAWAGLATRPLGGPGDPEGPGPEGPGGPLGWAGGALGWATMRASDE